MAWPSSPTYGDLLAEVQSWLDRDDADTVGRIPSFIRAAHDEIVEALRIPLAERTVTGSISAERATVPADFMAVRALTIDDDLASEISATSASLRAVHAARWPSGRPREFSVEVGDVAFAPIPDAAYTFTLTYAAAPLLMTATGDTNQVLQRRPFAYLEGALAAGFMFNRDTDQAALWDSKFRQTLANMQARGVIDAYSGPIRLRPSTGCCP